MMSDSGSVDVAAAGWARAAYPAQRDSSGVTHDRERAGLVETWWISRLGTDALAGMAVVFPVVMLMQYLLGPLVVGIGGTLVAVVGRNFGAGQPRRALGIAFIGGAAAFALTESIGVAAAIWPEAWLRLFDSNPAMLTSGSAYLRAVGPFYGFYGLGFALYFASQGAGRLLWPLLAGLLRLVVATGGGWLALRLTGSQGWLFTALAAGLLLYGILIPLAIVRGTWSSNRDGAQMIG
jgi:Na+-driven multidrug efflux pump